MNAHVRVGSLPAAVHGGVTSAHVAGRPAADLNGRDGYLEVADGLVLALGQADFSIALWVNPRRPLAGIPGELINTWNARQQRGSILRLLGNSSEYSSMSDTCYVQFDVDDALDGPGSEDVKPCASNSLINNLVASQVNSTPDRRRRSFP